MPGAGLLTNNVTMSLQGGERSIVWGTCMLGDTFGQVTGCDLTESGDMEVILNALGAARAVMFTNPGFEVELECVFDVDVIPPKTGDVMLMPYLNLQGVVVPGKTISYKDKASRTLKFKLHRWNSLPIDLTDDGDVKVYDYTGASGSVSYAVHENEFDGEGWRPGWAPEPD